MHVTLISAQNIGCMKLAKSTRMLVVTNYAKNNASTIYQSLFPGAAALLWFIHEWTKIQELPKEEMAKFYN